MLKIKLLLFKTAVIYFLSSTTVVQGQGVWGEAGFKAEGSKQAGDLHILVAAENVRLWSIILISRQEC